LQNGAGDQRCLVPASPALKQLTALDLGILCAASPFLYPGKYTGNVAPLARVVAVGDEAWTLDLLKKRRHIEAGDLVLTWEPGQASPLDTADIDAGQESATSSSSAALRVGWRMRFTM
jgi:hypothetical protein